MNEYNIKVDFTKGKIFTNLKELVQNDYNSTKLNFTFDKEGRVLFKLLYPDRTQYVDEIQNNELVFGPGILNQEGTYKYEMALYTEDGRLTDHAIKSFEVRGELVDTDELVIPDDRVPVLDKLIKEVTDLKNGIDGGSVTESEIRDLIVDVLKEYGLISYDTELTEEQIKAINEMVCEVSESGELGITYDDTVLDIDFSIENGELIVEDNEENIEFIINKNKEMEVIY